MKIYSKLFLAGIAISLAGILLLCITMAVLKKGLSSKKLNPDNSEAKRLKKLFFLSAYEM